MWIKSPGRGSTYEEKNSTGAASTRLARKMMLVIASQTQNGSTSSACHTPLRIELGKPFIYPSCYEISRSSFFFVKARWLTRYCFRCPLCLEGFEVFNCGVYL